MTIQSAFRSVILAILFLAISQVSISAASQKAQSYSYRKIYKVIDGDTFWIKKKDGYIDKIRLIGIDAPEARRSQYKNVQYFGKESKDYLTNYLKGKKVRLEYDVQKRDKYGRILAYVYLDNGVFLNNHLVRNGYAVAVKYPPNVKYQKQFLRSEREARNKKLSLWAKPNQRK